MVLASVIGHLELVFGPSSSADEPRSAGFQTCCIADFQSAEYPNSQKPWFKGEMRAKSFRGSLTMRSAAVLVVAVLKHQPQRFRKDLRSEICPDPRRSNRAFGA